ncbi:hypothetical protein ACFVWY_13120 [Streptomyces sp. NPDC058195]|uniref:hypothetical protein n=1 Tax=Streptomyces sp. NPDC058195 TaxID=3346375 RepID=UPI0036EE6010
MQDAERTRDDEHDHAPVTADAATPAGAPAKDDADWFDDVPDEQVGAVLSLDELAPYPGF